MIATHQFSCEAPGCRAYVRVDMTAHDSHKIDVEKLGEALGFWLNASSPFANNWRCRAHKIPTEVP